jgi:predicted secreted protein
VAATYEEGQQVRHEQYGLGFIVESDEDRTSIDFLDHGPKKFVTSMVTLEITDEQPKRKPRKSRARKTSGNGRQRTTKSKK